MASEKISEMTAASSVANADEVPILQGGVNKRATRAFLLTGADGEEIVLKAGDGEKVRITNHDGSCAIVLNDDGSVNLSFTSISIDASDNVVITSDLPENIFIDYQPESSGFDPLPTTIQEALNRLSLQLYIVGGNTYVP